MDDGSIWYQTLRKGNENMLERAMPPFVPSGQYAPLPSAPEKRKSDPHDYRYRRAL